MTLMDKARSGQNALEQIANAIPGFAGYRDRELRRDADRLEREYIADRLETCKKGLNEAAAAVTRSGNLDGINDIETARKRLDKAIARLRHADRGYSGFFDPIKVDEAALARVYEFDLSLVAGVEEVVAAGGDVKALATKIDALDARLSDRDAILAGIK
jgi:hypothetical protein